MRFIVNFIGFQIGWFACVLGAATGNPLLAISTVILILAIHLYRSQNYFVELCIILSASAIGFVWESLLILTDRLSYPSSNETQVFAPLWLIAMWASFATTINLSMAWLKKRWFLASIMGAIFGPLAFIAGEKLGAVVFVDRSSALLALSIGWACLMPLMLWLADRYQRRYQFMERI